MSVFRAQTLDDLSSFPDTSARLALLERAPPSPALLFFEALTQTPFRVSAIIKREDARDDIMWALAEVLPARHRADPFYAVWVSDMAEVCRTVCDMLKADNVLFRLDTFRGCKRYHVDNLPFRTVVTYYGLGTEYLTEEGANWDAYERGASNEEIVKDPSAIHTIAPWDVAVFRGGREGLLHKTPEAALKRPSVFMRVDPAPSE